MLLSDFLDVMECIAPKALALSFDNPGLLVGTRRTEINNVLVALDCTLDVAREAAATGADLVLTHHPLFFEPIKRILPDAPDTQAAYELISHGIGLFAAHTNLDAAAFGVNDCLASVLGLENVVLLPPDNLGRIGDLPSAQTFLEFARFTERALGARVRITGEDSAPVCRVALVGGSGGSDIALAKAAGADTFVTGEVKHNQALDAISLGINVIQAGHYETERVVLLPLIKRLQSLTHDVKYNLAQCETTCLRGIN